MRDFTHEFEHEGRQMITRREALKLATIATAGTIGAPKKLDASDVPTDAIEEKEKSAASLKFVAPDGDGTGQTVDRPGSVLQIPEWLDGCDSLIVEFLPGTYSDCLRLTDVPQTKRVILHGDASGKTVFLSKNRFPEGSIALTNCHNVSLHNVHFRQEGRDLKWFLIVTGCQDCLIHRCSWVGLSNRYGSATIQNQSERITMSDCSFEDTGNRGNTGSGAHQLYISGGGDNAETGYVRDVHIIRCTFADNFAGQHLKFKNGARDCFVDRCTFLRTNSETFGRFLNIRCVGDPNGPYPIVTNIFVLRCLFKDVTGEPSAVVNPAPVSRPDQYVFAQNRIEGSVSGLPSSV